MPMQKVLVFKLSSGSELSLHEPEAMALCECLLASARQHGWNETAFREMLAMTQAVGAGIELHYDPINTRSLYNLVASTLNAYLGSTQSVISMIFRWQQKNANQILPDKPPLIVTAQSEFDFVTLLCLLTAKLSEGVRDGSGLTIHTREAK